VRVRELAPRLFHNKWRSGATVPASNTGASEGTIMTTATIPNMLSNICEPIVQESKTAPATCRRR